MLCYSCIPLFVDFCIEKRIVNVFLSCNVIPINNVTVLIRVSSTATNKAELVSSRNIFWDLDSNVCGAIVFKS